MMTKKKIQALIDDLTEIQNFYRGEIDCVIKNAEECDYFAYKLDDIVTLYNPEYEPLGGPIQTTLDSCRGRIEGLQLAIDELKKEL